MIYLAFNATALWRVTCVSKRDVLSRTSSNTKLMVHTMFVFAPKEFSVSCNKTSFLGETFHSYYEKVVFINEIGILLLNCSRKSLVKAGK